MNSPVEAQDIGIPGVPEFWEGAEKKGTLINWFP